jgi:hypothetical protein
MISQIIRRLSLSFALLVTTIVLLSACNMFSPERHYLSSMFNHARRTLDTLGELRALTSEPDLNSEAWINDVENQVSTLRGLLNEARAITPPPRFEGVHNSYLDMMDQLEIVVEAYEQAIELRNNDRFQQALGLLEQVQRGIDTIVQQFETLQQQVEQEG